MPTIFNPKRKNAIFINTGGTVSPTPAPPSFNNTKSLLFDGVDEYINIGNNISELQPTGAFSISLWCKFDGLTGYQGLIEATSNVGVYGNDGYLIWKHTSTNKLQFYIRQGGAWKIASSTTVVTTGTWYHILATWDGSATSTIYINGVSEGTQSVTSITYNANTGHNIGGYASEGGTPYLMDGNIDEVSFWDTDINIDTVWDGTGKPTDLTSESNLVAWYRNGDNSTYKLPQILMPENTNKDKVSNYSMTFDGVDDRIQLSSDLTSSAEFTFSFWMKPTTVGSGNGKIYPIGTFPNNDNYIKLDQIGVLWLRIGATTIIFNEAVYGSGVNNLVLDEWQNITFIRDSSNIIRCYRNGTDFGYNVSSPSTNTNTLTLNSFGRIISNTFGFEGNLDEISWWTSDETANVSSIYNSGTPTTITGATAYWKLGEQAKFTDNWLVPNSALSNYSKFSFAFDGVDDYINCGNILDFTGSFSLSAWIKTSSAAGVMIMAKDDNAGGVGNNRKFLLQVLNSTGKGRIIVWHTNESTFANVQTTSAINDGNWHHIVAVNDTSGDLKIYVDGNDDSASVVSGVTPLNPTTVDFQIGARQYPSSRIFFDGLIDEVSAYNSALSGAEILNMFNSGEPTTITGSIAHWRMGEDASFNTNWSIPDQVASNNGTSANMTIRDLKGEAPNYSGSGISNAMTIEDRVGDAPNSYNNAVSFNMESTDIDNNTP